MHEKLQEKGKEHEFWEYITAFHAECYNEVTKLCHSNALKKTSVSKKEIQTCVDNTFGGETKNLHQVDNTYFRREKQYYIDYGPSFFPAIVVNNRTYMGTLDPENVFGAICSGFKDVPKVCRNRKFGLHQETGGVSTSKLILIIAGLVVLNIALILCYRKYAKKEADDKMQMHINSAVSQYFALHDKDRTSKPFV